MKLNFSLYIFSAAVAVTSGCKKDSTPLVEVPSVTLTALSISPKTLSLGMGESAKLTATPEPADVKGLQLVWQSSAPDVAATDANGTVTGKSTGTAKITVQADGIVSSPVDVSVVAAHVFSIESGWDIYPGGGYRYGPSIIIGNDNLIEAWFAAPGGTYGRDIENFLSSAHTAVSLGSGATAAQKFEVAQPFYSIGVTCPNWTTTNSSLTLTLFEWRGSYSATIASQPIKSQRFTNYADNQNLALADNSLFPAGTYLWVLSEPAGTAGVWKDAAKAGVTNYYNGAETTGSYEGFVSLTPSSGKTYWDQALYRTSVDGGKTWTAELPALRPTEGSRDELSVCDPGVIKIGNYYYAGYTSTEDTRGLFNHVYVARSTSPVGPWEKWNGTGWGGNPQPVITFNGNKDAWGAGEPCMVVTGETLYLYYTWDDVNVLQTRVATVNATDADWPAHLQLRGSAIDKSNINAADHCDVKYRDDLNVFQAIHTASRITANSYIVLWESPDGITFRKIAELRNGLHTYLHNCGWSGDECGHLNPNIQQYLAYAYGSEWANWKTAWHPIRF
ncbi:MAG: Ig-like domain-containing protein [Bacteroidales bacterium]|jgi:hypothetical protein|nr:Ig-like domain-containing protein [Bacteroidales bacterium]